MPDTNEGPADGTDNAVPAPVAAASPFADFAASMTAGLGAPDPMGEPESAKAVETVADEKAPEAPTEKPIEAPDAAKEKPADAKAVNFEGLSDETKTYWEKALKAGHATPADVERARIESLFQRNWTKRNEDLKVERLKIEKDRSELTQRKEDLAKLDRIRSSEQLLARWEKMNEATPDESDDELADKKSARQIALEVLEAKEAEKARLDAKRQGEYESRQVALQETVTEQIGTLGVTPQVMNGYLKQLEGSVPRGVDPVDHFTPAALVRELASLHKDAEISALKAELSKKASKSVQAAKQSLSPPGRTTEPPKSGLRKVLAEAGVALSDIQGLGWRTDQRD